MVTTVRSQAKACIIKEAYPDTPKSMLDVAIVEDLAQEGAFDKAAVSDPPFTVIIHTASPFHFNIKDIKKDFFEPAIRGTTNILKAAQAYAPTVERIVRSQEEIISACPSIVTMKLFRLLPLHLLR